ncbi:hypothetical protein AST04_10125 [Staphylococcus equorum]|nr:hypothetical protein AST04_10125 [Staphylococcus equorum]
MFPFLDAYLLKFNLIYITYIITVFQSFVIYVKLQTYQYFYLNLLRNGFILNFLIKIKEFSFNFNVERVYFDCKVKEDEVYLKVS